jgi:DNA-binding GntR family transcriptional regulator
VITIEHLEVLYDAIAERDEAVFARLFDRHIAEHDAQRDRTEADDRQARAERSLAARSPW